MDDVDRVVGEEEIVAARLNHLQDGLVPLDVDEGERELLGPGEALGEPELSLAGEALEGFERAASLNEGHEHRRGDKNESSAPGMNLEAEALREGFDGFLPGHVSEDQSDLLGQVRVDQDVLSPTGADGVKNVYQLRAFGPEVEAGAGSWLDL